MNICLFTQDEITKPLPVRDERGEHIIKILHKKAGDTFSAGIIGGMAGTATITEITGSTAECGGTVSFTFRPETDGKPLYPLTLIIGFPRPIQLKRLLRDIAGLGVCAVHLTGTELGEKSYMQSSLVERGTAYQMLLDGTVQAAGTHVPELFLHRTLAECLNAVQNDSKIKIALDNVRASCPLTGFLAAHPVKDDGQADVSVMAAIGSERGWTDNERAQLENAGWTRCSMGQRILRTETAATVAASVILAAMGKLDT
ncbi:MAG: RsmE family RNA methyltransferase [Treponema sp.]